MAFTHEVYTDGCDIDARCSLKLSVFVFPVFDYSQTQGLLLSYFIVSSQQQGTLNRKPFTETLSELRLEI